MHLFNLFGPNDLTKSILAEDWNSVTTICEVHPNEARSWSTRKGFFDGEHDSHVLPIHHAVSLRPPIHALNALIQAYPQGVRCKESSFKRLPIHIALQFSDSIDAIRLLLSYEPDSAMERDILDRIPLHYACSNGASEDVISALLAAYKRGAECEDLHGWVPLHVACFYGASWTVVEMLIEADPHSITKLTEKGSTPLKLISKVNCRDKNKIMAMLAAGQKAYENHNTENGKLQTPNLLQPTGYVDEYMPHVHQEASGNFRRRHNAISA